MKTVYTLYKRSYTNFIIINYHYHRLNHFFSQFSETCDRTVRQLPTSDNGVYGGLRCETRNSKPVVGTLVVSSLLLSNSGKKWLLILGVISNFNWHIGLCTLHNSVLRKKLLISYGSENLLQRRFCKYIYIYIYKYIYIIIFNLKIIDVGPTCIVIKQFNIIAPSFKFLVFGTLNQTCLKTGFFEF